MKYIFFDLDGTLLNTRDGIIQSIVNALKEEEISFADDSVLDRHIGPPIKEGFMKYYNFSDEKADHVVHVFRGYYNKIWKSGTKTYDGVAECLQKLKGEGYHLIVATSKLESMAKEFLEYFSLAQYFEDICGSSLDMTRSKKVDVIQYAIQKNGIPSKHEIYMVGDRSYDVLGANEVGIPCIGVLYGFGTEQELRSAGAIECVRTPEELYQYVKKQAV